MNAWVNGDMVASISQILFILCILNSFHPVKSNQNQGNTRFERELGNEEHIFELQYKSGCRQLINQLENAFAEEKYVTFKHVELDGEANSCSTTDIAISHHGVIPLDRTCLVSSPLAKERPMTRFYPKSTVFNKTAIIENMIDFVNKQASTFRAISGEKTSLGLYLSSISTSIDSNLNKIRSVSKCPSIDYEDFAKDPSLFVQSYWIKQRPVVIKNFPTVTQQNTSKLLSTLFDYYDKTVGVKLSPSTDFEGIESVHLWGMAKHQKIPDKVLEQLESPHLCVVRAHHEEMLLGHVMELISRSSIELNSTQCRRHLGSVPVTGKEGNDDTCAAVVNAYVEYLELNDYNLPGLLNKLLPLKQFPAWLGLSHQVARNAKTSGNDGSYNETDDEQNIILKKGKAHLWLGDGRHRGKLHFDPFDNILVQIEGKKRFLMIESSVTTNTQLREGHMREAQIEAEVTYSSRATYSPSTPSSTYRKHSSAIGNDQTPFKISKFRSQRVEVTHFNKNTLTESTSMVHSPLDVFQGALPTVGSPPPDQSIQGAFYDCEVTSGDALYMPSFWWHEVISTPGPSVKFNHIPSHSDLTLLSRASATVLLNVAINYWFEPLFTKEFPCASCPKRINLVHYLDLLESLMKKM